jgi:hypothetical protein
VNILSNGINYAELSVAFFILFRQAHGIQQQQSKHSSLICSTDCLETISFQSEAIFASKTKRKRRIYASRPSPYPTLGKNNM